MMIFFFKGWTVSRPDVGVSLSLETYFEACCCTPKRLKQHRPVGPVDQPRRLPRIN